MITQLQRLKTEVMHLVSDSAKVGDTLRVAHLAGLGVQVGKLQDQFLSMEAEFKELEAKIAALKTPGPLPEPSPPPPGRDLYLEIDWSRLGKDTGKQIICEHKSSETLVRFVEALCSGIGTEVLEKLASLRVYRGPFVSRDPRTDYKNRNGRLYQSHRVGVSDYSVLTHSGSGTKVKQVADVCQHLGLPQRAVIARLVDRKALFAPPPVALGK